MYKEQHREAIAYFKEALELKPDYLEAHLNIAAIY
ncbi:tetratricopeptide repeat protein [Coxiella-like endosymbiont]|nr:tetratricopeptide repeat protein [Coxiella-like endosymbiont]